MASKTVSFVSLGCPKNLIDSESILGLLNEAGYSLVSEDSPSDLTLLNTCGFIASAREEAFEEIQRLIERKKSGLISQLVVCGCLIPLQGVTLAERFPEVDLWLDPFEEENLLSYLSGTKETPDLSLSVVSIPNIAKERRKFSFFDEKRLLLTVPHTAYLKIADGCDRFCSYCAIPMIRGRFVSKPMENILEEAKVLADSGVRELILIAQETTFWGIDLSKKKKLAQLLISLRELNLFDWIRVLYAYPTGWDQDLIVQFSDISSGYTRLLPYIDLPLQHANDRMLRAMNRSVGKTQTEELLFRLREEIPELVLRTTFITGFPGETEEDFNELLSFVKKWRFERSGVFPFSSEVGTKAALLPDPVSESVKQRRYKKLQALTLRNAENFAQKRVGNIVDVMIDTPLLSDDGEPIDCVWVGRSYAESPDIDPVVYVNCQEENRDQCEPGKILPVEIVAAQKLDLIAVF